MKASDSLVAESGLAYDRARWAHWVPEVSHVHQMSGLSTLLQTVPAHINAATETDVPPTSVTTLLFWTKGQPVRFRIDGEPSSIVPRAWDFTLLPSQASSWWECTRRSAHGVVHIHLDSSLLAQTLGLDGAPASCFQMPVIAHGQDEMVRGLARWLFDEVERSAKPQQLLWDTAATALALRLANLGRDAPRRAVPLGGLAPWQLRRLSDYMQEHLANDVSLSQLAQLADLSPSHLCRAFKQSTGLPPHRWQLLRRIDKARDLLACTQLSVTEVAAAVGYDDAGQFATAFRKSVGLTPSQYRTERRQ